MILMMLPCACARRMSRRRNTATYFTRIHTFSSSSDRYYSSIMFFFFVGGVEPTVRRTIETRVAPCPNCRDGTLDLVEMGKTFKAFFIPVYNFGESKELLRCDKCNCIMQPLGNGPRIRNSGGGGGNVVCSCCGTTLQPEWHFCPTCGVDASTTQGIIAAGVPVDRE